MHLELGTLDASPGTCWRWRTASPRRGTSRGGTGWFQRARGRPVRHRAPRRGIYSGGEVLVESGAPFGLFYGRRRVRVDSEVVVYPRTFDVAGLPPSATVDTERGDRSEASTLHRGHGGELWGVREYRPGDPARLVAWKRSARGLPRGGSPSWSWPRRRIPLRGRVEPGPRAPREAREMVVSLGASLLLYGLDEGRRSGRTPDPRTSPSPRR